MSGHVKFDGSPPFGVSVSTTDAKLSLYVYHMRKFSLPWRQGSVRGKFEQ